MVRRYAGSGDLHNVKLYRWVDVSTEMLYGTHRKQMDIAYNHSSTWPQVIDTKYTSDPLPISLERYKTHRASPKTV